MSWVQCLALLAVILESALLATNTLIQFQAANVKVLQGL